MNGGGARSMTFQAEPPDVFAALLEAARRAGFQYLSGDTSTGTAVFTSGRLLLAAGEKVHAQWEVAAPGTVEVRISTANLGIAGAGRPSPGLDRFSDELSGLLPHVP